MRLLGRGTETSRLSARLDDVRAGRGAVLLLEGEAGIGKTALLEWAAAQASDMQVLRATGVESELELAFSGLAELCLPLLEHIDEIPSPQRQALRAALALEDGLSGDRFVLALATTSLLQAAARPRPVLLLVDDAQWLDRASADALAFVIRRLHDGPIGIFVAARSGELDLRGVEVLEVAGLPEGSALELLADLSEMSSEVAHQLVDLTAGNPLALEEVVAALTPEELAGTRRLADPPRVGPSLERAFARRLEPLSSDARKTLLVASAGVAHPLSVIAGALSSEGLAAAEDSGLLRIVEDRIVFRHPLARAAVYHSAVPSAQRAAHRKLADVLDGDSRAWHLAAAAVGIDETAAAALEQVGEDVKRRRGHGPAAAAFRRAAELTGDPARRRHRLQLAAEAATLAGLVPLAREAIGEAERLQPDPRQQAELGFLQGLLLIHTGEDATGAFAVAGRSIADEHPERAALMLAWASEAAIYRRNWEAAEALAGEAFRLVRGSGGVAEFWATWMEGVVLTELGQSEAAAVLERAIEVFRGQLAGADDPRLLANFSVALMYRDDFRGGLAAAERAASEARQHGAVPTLLFASSFELVARLVLGDWDRARADAAELHALALDSENRSELDDFLWTQAYVAAARGDADRYAAFEVLVDPARDPRVALCEGLLALGLEDPGRAVEILAALVQPGELAGYAAPDMSPFDLVEALLRCGEEQRASYLLEAFESFRHRTWVAAGLARCLALTGGSDFELQFEEARTRFASIGFAFEVARTDLYHGELLRRKRRRGEAREPLTRALAAFEGLAADPWAARTQAGLRAAGVKTDERAPGRLGALSERERQVALAAVDGKTNREIGADLFLSPRTVELHLASAYRKLGIRRRSELGRLVSGLGVAEDT
jgi:DNA-binding CsgD family transcriptional regulator